MGIRGVTLPIVPAVLQASASKTLQGTLSTSPPQRVIEPTDPSYGGQESCVMNSVVVPGVYPSPAPLNCWVVTV